MVRFPIRDYPFTRETNKGQRKVNIAAAAMPFNHKAEIQLVGKSLQHSTIASY